MHRMISLPVSLVVLALTIRSAAAAPADLPVEPAGTVSLVSTLSPPFSYAAENTSRADFNATWQMLRALLQPGDGLVLLYPDGDYSLFTCPHSQQLVLYKPAKLDPEQLFPRLKTTFPRTWILLYDQRLAWHAAPPPARAAELQQHYVRLPFNLPVYAAFRDAPKGSTNSFHMQARFLEQMMRLQPALQNPAMFRDLATIYRKAGDVPAAVDVYSRGIERFPTDPYLHRALGECLYWLCDPPRIADSITHNLFAHQYHREQLGRPMYDALFNAAIAYSTRGELTNAMIQYTAILKLLTDFPDDRTESQIRRYLATVYARLGRTNEAVNQLELDIRLQAQNPAYSYTTILDWYRALQKTNHYRRLVTEYFTSRTTNDIQAVTRYSYHIAETGSEREISEMIARLKRYIRRNSEFTTRMREQTGWWNMWSNITTARGYAPVEP